MKNRDEELEVEEQQVTLKIVLIFFVVNSLF